MNYAVEIYSPPNYAHAGAFAEVADTVRYGLIALGRLGSLAEARRIVFGVNLLPKNYFRPNTVLYNLEQLGSPWLDPPMLDVFRRHEVWDYSASNVAWLKERDVHAKHVPIGYEPRMERIIPASVKDIDVLHYGCLNDRRTKIINALHERGLRTAHVFGMYGAERDALIARAKVVLNVHYYEAKIFEMVRCSYLFNNRVCVVSEESEDVPRELAGGGLRFAPYDALVERCVQLLAPSPLPVLDMLAFETYQAFKSRPETEYLKKAIS